MRLLEVLVDIPKWRRYAQEVIRAGGVTEVWLIGSAATNIEPNDIDLLYVLDFDPGMQADDDDESLIDFIENHTGIHSDMEHVDSFYRAGNTWWYLAFGAGAALIRNDAYAQAQAGRPKILLASVSQGGDTVYGPRRRRRH